MEKKYGLRCPNVFHAGDGNLHPLILFDANSADELHRTEQFAAEVLEKCIAVGGTITGEHGVGVEKINQMCVQFGAGELELFQRRSSAPSIRAGLLNPGKAVPTLARCAEYRPHARPAAASCRIPSCRAFEPAGATGAHPRGGGRAAPRCGCAAAAPRTSTATRRAARSSTRAPTPASSPTSRPSWWSRRAAARRLSSWKTTLAGNKASFCPSSRRISAPARRSAAASRPGCPGPRRASAGALRDFVLGAKLIDGRGQVLGFGGQVMKNVAGYDVSRLLAGSLGTLGLIAEVSLKVLPRPPVEATLRLRMPRRARSRR